MIEKLIIRAMPKSLSKKMSLIKGLLISMSYPKQLLLILHTPLFFKIK